MRNLPIIALDFKSADEVHTFLNKFNEPLCVKIGMELFYQTGPALIKSIKKRGHDIFLDLKLHDIPNTVSKAMEGLARLDVDLVNVHAAGGIKMMEEAKKGLRTERQLHEEQNIQTSIEEAVLNYARLTKKAGLDGVVCSPLEAEMISKELGTDFLKVTPGIRPKGAARNDQQRITTPEEAKTLGSTHIVVGRPITQSEHPIDSYHKIKESWLS
ncbi:orotidine 5'-phosphate decarboxylase [Paenibacillus macerans]|nr:orotidine 5'-phosphate decarboxylase [Paenibacillus macerans]